MRRGRQLGQAHPLPTFSVKIFWCQPTLESGLDRRPFAIEYREPRRITVASLVDIGLETPSNVKPRLIAAARDKRRKQIVSKVNV